MGFFVAPALFSMLDDRALAGRLAGALFGLELYVACGCAILLVAHELIRARRSAFAIGVPLAMLAAIATIDLILRPMIADAAPGSREFAWLHGTAVSLYLLASVLGLALVLVHPRGAPR